MTPKRRRRGAWTPRWEEGETKRSQRRVATADSFSTAGRGKLRAVEDGAMLSYEPTSLALISTNRFAPPAAGDPSAQSQPARGLGARLHGARRGPFP